MGLKGGEMGEKDDVKEKFSIWHFQGKKVGKAHLSAYGRLRLKTARRMLRRFRKLRNLAKSRIADAMALRAPRCQLCAF